MRKYGVYKFNPPSYPTIYYDVDDTQDSLPKGSRIRRKKDKRRVHKKASRQIGVKQARTEINEH